MHLNYAMYYEIDLFIRLANERVCSVINIKGNQGLVQAALGKC